MCGISQTIAVHRGMSGDNTEGGREGYRKPGRVQEEGRRQYRGRAIGPSEASGLQVGRCLDNTRAGEPVSGNKGYVEGEEERRKRAVAEEEEGGGEGRG